MEMADCGVKENVEIGSVMPSSGADVETNKEGHVKFEEPNLKSIKNDETNDQSYDLTQVDSDHNIGKTESCKPTNEESSSVPENPEQKPQNKGKKKKVDTLEVWKDVLMGNSNFERRKKLKNINIASHSETQVNPPSTNSIDNTNSINGTQNKVQTNLKYSLSDNASKPLTCSEQSQESSEHLPGWDENMEKLRKKSRQLFNRASENGFNGPAGANYKKALQEYKKAYRNLKRRQSKHKHWNYLMFY